MKSIAGFLLTTTLLTSCDNVQKEGAFLRDYANGQKLASLQIQEAIDNLHEKGGGTLIIPPGKYLVGTLHLKSNVGLYLAAGTTLLGSTDMADYDVEHPHLIYCDPCENVSISGQGKIDGQGMNFFEEDFSPKERPEPWLVFYEGSNIKIEDIILQNSPSHVLSLNFCDRVWVENITVKNHPRSPNTDGIDIKDSKNVVVRGCFIQTGDDAICLKANKDTIENVLVSNCILQSDDAAIKFGTGSESVVQFCRFENINIQNTRYGIALFMLEGGLYQHCQFHQISISGKSRHRLEYPIFIDIDQKSPDYPLGRISDIKLSDIDIYSSGKVLIAGQDQQKIGRIELNNVTLYNNKPTDFAEASKPRGNKSYPRNVAAIDLSSDPGHYVFGYIDQLRMNNVQLLLNGSVTPNGYTIEEVKDLSHH